MSGGGAGEAAVHLVEGRARGEPVLAVRTFTREEVREQDRALARQQATLPWVAEMR